MTETYFLALDQGTTSSRAIVFDAQGLPRALAAREIKQIYPRPGWVEHDPTQIWETQIAVAHEALSRLGLAGSDIRAVGITNQRETTICWERATGRPVYNAIVWQCRRTAPLVGRLIEQGLDRLVLERTGLVTDAYFSGTKIRWLLDEVPGLRKRAEAGEILFGTVDTWLLYNLTGGRVHATDPSNASRTMLFNIHDLAWDRDLLNALDVPEKMLPAVLPSNHLFGRTAPEYFGGAGIPIAGIIGDQQAALFGQACYEPGQAKVTYGTGAFLLMNTGPRAVPSPSRLLTTIAWQIGRETTYGLEGSVFIAGAVIQWLRDELGLIASAKESEAVARSVEDNGGVYLVPALAGLGAPYWDMRARGLVVGLTRGSNRGHVVRAALESIAFQTRDLLAAMATDAGLPLTVLRVDGGAAGNELLLEFQADILGAVVHRPRTIETTALGAAYMAGLGVGHFRDTRAIEANWQLDREYRPAMAAERRERLYRKWQRAVARARDWAEDDD
jgi:glycerol kinase